MQKLQQAGQDARDAKNERLISIDQADKFFLFRLPLQQLNWAHDATVPTHSPAG